MKVNTLELSKKLLLRYESLRRIDNYYGLLAYYALCQTADAAKDKEMMKKAKEYLGLYPDKFEHTPYNFESYRVGGNGKAWLLFKGYINDNDGQIRKYAEKTLNAPADKNGIMCMPQYIDKQMVWIDVVTCTTPFMLYIGLALNEEKYIDFAAEQCFKMYELFLDKTCGLLHQSRGFMENMEFLSEDHWSRGNGWGYVGLAELVKYLPKDSKHREKAQKYFVDMSNALLKYQTKKGLWRQEITQELAWEESSGTGLILYCMGVGIRYGYLTDEKFKIAFEKGVYGLAKYCVEEDYSTHRSCPGCLCPGHGEDKGSKKAYITEKIPQQDEVHSYGCMMLAFTEAFKNEINEVEISTNIYC